MNLKNKNMEILSTNLLSAIGGAFIALTIIYFMVNPKMEELVRLKRNQAYHDTTYLRKSGGTSLYNNKAAYNGKDFFNYDLRSWDGGKNWYAVNYIYETDEVKVLGTADSVYPKLLEHLKAWEDLENYAIKNAGVDVTKKEGVEQLEKVGFKVVTHPN